MNKYFADGITRDWADDDFLTLVFELERLKEKIFEKEYRIYKMEQELAKIRGTVFTSVNPLTIRQAVY